MEERNFVKKNDIILNYIIKLLKYKSARLIIKLIIKYSLFVER